MVFGTFLLHCCAIFEHINTTWVFLCLVYPVLVFWSVFRIYSQLHPGRNDGLHFLLLALNVVLENLVLFQFSPNYKCSKSQFKDKAHNSVKFSFAQIQYFWWQMNSSRIKETRFSRSFKTKFKPSKVQILCLNVYKIL